MQYLDTARMGAIATESFRDADPYPWINPAALIRPEAYERLRNDLPPVEVLKPSFGMKRRHGQQAHDRYVLEYHDGAPVAQSWQDFVAELKGPTYRDWLQRLFGVKNFFLTFHWHYTPNGCSVSPHCDAKRKMGSHIFYLNTEEDWDPSWGGQTVILDDGGRFETGSAPAFADFEREMPSVAVGNYSLLFGRKGNSWHGVHAIDCPEGNLRKVFIVVINRLTPTAFVKRWTARLRAG